MKKYKLIKEYPGSRNLGTIIENDSGGGYDMPDNDDKDCMSFTEIIFEPMDFPQFWKEVIKKNYEILSFKIGIHIITKKGHFWEDNNPNTKYFSSTRNISFLLDNPNTYKIHSVKRLSDSKIFTIGDTVNDLNSIPFPYSIGAISLQDNNIKFYNNGVYFQDLETVNHYTKPLFVTEDKVNIFIKDTYYWIHKHSFQIHKETIKHILDANAKENGYNVLKNFYCKTKAKEYVLLNKPCMSLNDVSKFYTSAKNGKSINSKGLIELVKSKM